MIFNTFQFVWLFPLIFIGYYFIPKLISKEERVRSKFSNILLLLISYGVYMQYEPVYALVLLGVTAITYLSALLIEREQAYGNHKYLICIGVALTLLPLFAFKYAPFVNQLLLNVGIGSNRLVRLDIVIPLGLSFFTLQALGYLLDVYYQRIKAERDWWNYMLFVAFFPQILCGPISRAKDLLSQIKSDRKFDYDKAVQGLKWLLWGMFLKVVLADNTAVYVDKVFSEFDSATGSACLLALFFYSFQIYGDFAGYSLMAMGVGRVMGFDLVNNFNRPYFSISVSEFWRRWHISLSTWLRDYVYIPLGGSRCSKPRSYWNVFVTFLISGVWHGANLTYIVWGALHGLYLMVEKMLGVQKCENRKWWIIIPRIVITFVLVSFAWLFFRSPSIEYAWNYIVKIFTNYGGELYFPLGNAYVLASIVSLLLVLSVDCVTEYFPRKKSLMYSRCLIVRWLSYLILCLSLLLMGVLDSNGFIYGGF